MAAKVASSTDDILGHPLKGMEAEKKDCLLYRKYFRASFKRIGSKKTRICGFNFLNYKRRNVILLKTKWKQKDNVHVAFQFIKGEK